VGQDFILRPICKSASRVWPSD